jgi:DNA-binding NarL/FixJ family response regulator
MSHQSHRPRVLLADDNACVRAAVSRLLSPSCDVVGDAPDRATLLDATMQLRPDVILLDFSLPGGESPIELCRRLKTMAPEVDIVAFTAHNDGELRRLALEAGFSGFVCKLQPADDLLLTIQAVVNRAARPGGGDTA